MGRREWKPTEYQQALLRVCQEANYAISINAASIKVGIDDHTAYNYWNTPEFVDWWETARKQHWSRQLTQIDAAVVGGALGTTELSRDQVQAAKLAYERFDDAYMPKSRSELTGKGGGPVQVQETPFHVHLADSGPKPEKPDAPSAPGATNDDQPGPGVNP